MTGANRDKPKRHVALSSLELIQKLTVYEEFSGFFMLVVSNLVRFQSLRQMIISNRPSFAQNNPVLHGKA